MKSVIMESYYIHHTKQLTGMKRSSAIWGEHSLVSGLSNLGLGQGNTILMLTRSQSLSLTGQLDRYLKRKGVAMLGRVMEKSTLSPKYPQRVRLLCAASQTPQL